MSRYYWHDHQLGHISGLAYCKFLHVSGLRGRYADLTDCKDSISLEELTMAVRRQSQVRRRCLPPRLRFYSRSFE